MFAGTEEVDFVLGSPAVEEEPLFFDDGLAEFGEALGVVCGRGWEAEGGDDGWGHGGVVGFGEGDPVDGLFFDWEGSGERVCEAGVAFSGEGFDGVAGGFEFGEMLREGRMIAGGWRGHEDERGFGDLVDHVEEPAVGCEEVGETGGGVEGVDCAVAEDDDGGFDFCELDFEAIEALLGRAEVGTAFAARRVAGPAHVAEADVFAGAGGGDGGFEVAVVAVAFEDRVAEHDNGVAFAEGERAGFRECWEGGGLSGGGGDEAEGSCGGEEAGGEWGHGGERE